MKTADELRAALRAGVASLLAPPPGLSPELQLTGRPAVILIAGVNGAGKTTTIGKLAAKLGKEGASVGG